MDAARAGGAAKEARFDRKAARGLYEYFWMYAGLLYMGASRPRVQHALLALYLIRGRAALARAANRRSDRVLLRISSAMLIASGLLRVDLSALHALRGRGGIHHRAQSPEHAGRAAHHLARSRGRLHHEGADLGQPGAGRRRAADGLHPQ